MHEPKECSCFLASTKNGQRVTLKRFQVNLWALTDKQSFADIGLLIELDPSQAFEGDTVDLFLKTPFCPKKGSLQDLFGVLNSDHLLQLVFNDRLVSREQISLIADSATRITFQGGLSFSFFRVNLDQDKEDTLHVQIPLAAARLTMPEPTAALGAHWIYTRFRFEIDLQRSANIYTETGTSRTRLLYDFRFNEARLFSVQQQQEFRRIIRIEAIQVFLIQSTQYRLARETIAPAKYVRLLERGKDRWDAYLPELTRHSKTFLVYYWKPDLDKSQIGTSSALLVCFDADRVDIVQRLIIAFLLASISGLSLILFQDAGVARLYGHYAG